MSRIPALLLFLIFFQIEVRVKALGTEPLFEGPPGCLQKEAIQCVLQTQDVPLNFSLKKFAQGDGEIQLSRESMFARDLHGQLRFVQGALRVQGEYELKKPLSLYFLHGHIQAGSGSFLIYSDEEGAKSGKVWVANESAELKLRLRSGETLDLPVGFEVWVDGLNSLGQQDYGMVRPWELGNQIRLTNQFSLGSKLKRLELAEQLRTFSKLAHNQVAELYTKVAERHLASLAEEENLRLAKIEAQRQAKARLKRFYFERTFGK
jgi:hypothetical protein